MFGFLLRHFLEELGTVRIIAFQPLSEPNVGADGFFLVIDRNREDLRVGSSSKRRRRAGDRNCDMENDADDIGATFQISKSKATDFG